jgi:aconitate hydratase
MNAGSPRGWRAFFSTLTGPQRRDVREILAEDYAAEIRFARQLAQHANRLSRYPAHRARLLAVAAREEEHARWLREAIERLGGRPPERVPSPPDARTNWERLVDDLEAEKAALEKYLDDAYAVERDRPDIAALLLRIRAEEAAHRSEIATILARSERAVLDRPTLDAVARRTLTIGDRACTFWSLPALARHLGVSLARLPFAIRVLLENLLRREDGWGVTEEDVEAVARWAPFTPSPREVAFQPARVLLQDFTGVPVIADLAALRDAVAARGGDPATVTARIPADLVVDHSVQVDRFGASDALAANAHLELARNGERFAFLRWAQQAFPGLRVVPPATGIVHQVNLEHLARVVFVEATDGGVRAYPDTVVGTDSHTPMVNALGVLGWGVGGIEAEAALLGLPVPLTIPRVVGVRLAGRLREGVTATDLVLTVTARLRAHGVVGQFVEFCGPAVGALSVPDRATLANMAPEYGATVGFFPVDAATLDYLRFTGREAAHVALVEAYTRAQELFRADDAPEPIYSSLVHLDLDTVEACLAGPRRPHDRVPLGEGRPSVRRALAAITGASTDTADALAVTRWVEEGWPAASDAGRPAPAPGRLGERVATEIGGTRVELAHGAVVIAAITSCTNTSNPSAMVGAGLLARNAVARGLRAKAWVKTSLAPGSRVVTEYLAASGLLADLERLGFHLVGYGCTTCIGNSGPLPGPVERAIIEGGLGVAAVLSGNRNFDGRIHPLVQLVYLAAPALVVAYALAGTMDIDLVREPLGIDAAGLPVYLRDVWPTSGEVAAAIAGAVRPEQFRAVYARLLDGDEGWRALPARGDVVFAWDEASTYIRRPPFFDDVPAEAPPLADLRGLRALVVLGDSVTTDHISPAGAIAPTSPAGRYLIERGVSPRDFNSYGARRGNHEVMVRGTFANPRLRNELVPGTDGGVTIHFPSGERMTIFEAAMRYRAEGVGLLVLAGAEYGAGSSRDWAAKGPRLLGVRAVLAEGFERIHRSNLVGMGVLPLEFESGQGRRALGLDGRERFDVEGLAALVPGGTLRVHAVADDGSSRAFTVRARVDTPLELEYVRHGGILPCVLRRLSGKVAG